MSAAAAAAAAAVRRWLVSSSFNNIGFVPQTVIGKQQHASSIKTTRKWRLVAAAAAAGACGAACYYYYHHHHHHSCEGGSTNRFGLKRHAEARVLRHLPLPSVSAAASKVVDDGETHRSAHERRFYQFCSVELEGQLYMTPLNFIESVTMSQPKGSRSSWKSLTRKELEKMLADTPPIGKGSSNMFRNLRERGIISYTEYLFLLCILTKPLTGFKIAFNMLDHDGNQMVDKQEFFLLEDIFRKKSDRKEAAAAEEDQERSDDQALQLYGPSGGHSVLPDASEQPGAEPHAAGGRGMWDTLRRGASQVVFSDLSEHVDDIKTDTTLLVHFFGRKGKAELNFEDFYKFMDNLQTEVLEVEFLSYSKGLPIITEEDFAQILLRYTTVDSIDDHMENLRHAMQDEKGITFEEFRTFFQFLNNLEDFTIAMHMYSFANRAVGQDEFIRAVYVATGLRLTPHVVNTVFKIFDEDGDGQLGHKEFIGIMKDRLHRSERGLKMEEKFTSFKSCLKKQLSGK